MRHSCTLLCCNSGEWACATGTRRAAVWKFRRPGGCEGGGRGGGGHTAHLAPTLPLLHSPTATAASIGGHWAYKRPSLTGLKKTLNQTGSILDQHQANNRTEPDLFCNSWLTLVLDWGLHEDHIGHNTTHQKSNN